MRTIPEQDANPQLTGPVAVNAPHGAWRQAAAAIEEYRTTYHVHDPERALGREPHDLAQRTAWRQARSAVERVWHKQRTAEQARDNEQPSTPMPTDRTTRQRAARSGRQGPERAAG